MVQKNSSILNLLKTKTPFLNQACENRHKPNIMRKKLIAPVALAIAVMLSSCGGKSSFEADVRKMANYRCKAQQLMAKEATDEKAKKELDDLRKEMEAYTEKMEEKYKDKKDDKEMEERADKIMQEVMSKCK